MKHRVDQIGFSQRIRLEWLIRTANLVLAGKDAPFIYSALQELLQDKLSVGGLAPRSNREKAITILMKVWVRPPQDLVPFQRVGLQLLSHLPQNVHMAVHWGMVLAVYPFWGSVAAQVGRLLKLQGAAAASQIQRRVREQYGERETVSRAARRVLRSFVDWGVLGEGAEPGMYIQGLSHAIEQAELIAWLSEACLYAHPDRAMALQTVLGSPSLFPFHLSPIPANVLVATSGRLDTLRHGLDQEVIMLRR